MFEDLARNGDGEVRTQALFALCELEIGHSKCNAKACYQRIADDARSAQDVAKEARSLSRRLDVDQCDAE
jgi:hypothetical protein